MSVFKVYASDSIKAVPCTMFGIILLNIAYLLTNVILFYI